jgi:hypothetical protein
LTGGCTVTVRTSNERRKVRVRAPRSVYLMSALTVVRMLDPMASIYEVSDLDQVDLESELDSPFPTQSSSLNG